MPPATQQTILNTNVLRYVKTTKEMRNAIAKLFMDLGVKPWTRAWEKKAYSGSGKKRCDACMRRSDRENALFADPDAPGKGKSMCLDPQCWKAKCLSWSRSLINDNPGMVPIRHGYYFESDDLGEVFGVEPVRRYNWQERDGADTEREGYTAAVGVFVDGPEIGTTKTVWLEQQDEDDAEGGDDDSSIEQWRTANAKKHQMRQEIAEIIAAEDIARLYNGDRDHDADNALEATLTEMFEIPLDTITARAEEELSDNDAQGGYGSRDAGDIGANNREDGSESDVPVIPVDIETLTETADFIPVDCLSYLPALTEA